MRCWVFDKDWKLVEGNPAAKTLFGEPIDETIKEHFSLLVQNEEIEEHQILRNSFVLQNEKEVQHFDVIVSPLVMGGQLIGYQMLLRDVSELVHSMEKLEQLATTDPLTGLNNRRFFHLEGERIYDLAQRYDHSICVMTFDLDHFKEINDRFGHHSGDEVLMEVADLIKMTSRKSDIVARFGGDEFFVLLPESTNGYAVALAKRLQAKLKEDPFDLEGNLISISFSFGIASCEPGKPEALSLDALMRQADLQLYEAKKGGRDQIRMISF
jgi:diguanylate cyclase (GGDEF)-like protein